MENLEEEIKTDDLNEYQIKDLCIKLQSKDTKVALESTTILRKELLNSMKLFQLIFKEKR